MQLCFLWKSLWYQVYYDCIMQYMLADTSLIWTTRIITSNNKRSEVIFNNVHELYYTLSKWARNIHAIFSCFSITPIKKSFVPISWYSSHLSASVRKLLIICLWSANRFEIIGNSSGYFPGFSWIEPCSTNSARVPSDLPLRVRARSATSSIISSICSYRSWKNLCLSLKLSPTTFQW